MMSRPAALRALAFSATAMMALGLARPMRLASWGIGTSAELGWDGGHFDFQAR